MKKLAGLLFTLLIFSVPAFAQGKPAAHSNPSGGHIPAHGPAPVKTARPAPEHPPSYADKKGHPDAPHVHANGKWIGHDTGPNDPHYHLDHPWEHGHFPGLLGASIFTGWWAGGRGDSGLADGISAWRHMTSVFATIGRGIRTTL